MECEADVLDNPILRNAACFQKRFGAVLARRPRLAGRKEHLQVRANHQGDHPVDRELLRKANRLDFSVPEHGNQVLQSRSTSPRLCEI